MNAIQSEVVFQFAIFPVSPNLGIVFPGDQEGGGGGVLRQVWGGGERRSTKEVAREMQLGMFSAIKKLHLTASGAIMAEEAPLFQLQRWKFLQIAGRICYLYGIFCLKFESLRPSSFRTVHFFSRELAFKARYQLLSLKFERSDECFCTNFCGS